ncbi:hypothetical protein YC2023_080346 [Brassica napus]
MEDQNQTSFTFMINNLSDKRTESPKFLNGGWEWVVHVYSKEEDHKLYVYHFLWLANPESLRPGLIIRVSFFFVMLNQSGKELYRTKANYLFLEIFTTIPASPFTTKNSIEICNTTDINYIKLNTAHLHISEIITQIAMRYSATCHSHHSRK